MEDKTEPRFIHKAMVIIDNFENKAYYLNDNEDLSFIVRYMNIEDDYTKRLEHHLQRFKRINNEQQATIDKQNELIKLIAKACTYSKEHSVKEILRKEIRGIDTVTEESANAWHDYIILSEFFKECYGEHWDNFD